jgi:hypothetical protein
MYGFAEYLPKDDMSDSSEKADEIPSPGIVCGRGATSDSFELGQQVSTKVRVEVRVESTVVGCDIVLTVTIPT